MIAAPCLVRFNRRGDAVAATALVPVPAAGCFEWNAHLRAKGRRA